MLVNESNSRLYSIVNERYKILRTNITHLKGMDESRAILVSDIDGHIDKEKVICNLGIAFSKLKDKKVLLIDADFKKADMNSFFNLDNNFGLSNAIMHPSVLLRTIQVVIPEQLYFLATGPVPLNTAELLSTLEMKSIMYYLKKHFDLTIINAPPICDCADPQIIASLVDGNILLVKQGATSIKKIKEAKLAIERVNATILGAVQVT